MMLQSRLLVAVLTVAGALVVPPARAQEAVPAAKTYADAARALDAFITAEMASKDVAGLSVALVDGDRVVWAKGYGLADPEKKTPATAETLYPLGSVSKLLTALLTLQLARDGKIDLDAPVTTYVRGFKPKNPFDKAVTVRHLLAHCSGIVREPPVGNYFASDDATRAAMTDSLNGTELVYKPGTQYKYSNAAFALAGVVAETAAEKPFEQLIDDRIFGPLEMKHSSFRTTGRAKAVVARGQGWTQYGRTFPIPPADHAALAPAGGAVSSVLEVGRLIPALYPADAKGPFHPDDLKAAFTRQYPDIKAERSYGLGFILSDFQGKKKVSHGGAVNGCVTEFAVLPDDRLGVVVCATKESANALTRRVAEAVLAQAVAARAGGPLPPLDSTAPLSRQTAKALGGLYKGKDDSVEVLVSGERAWLVAAAGGTLKELRSLRGELIVDDPLSFGTAVKLTGDTLRVDGRPYERVAASAPKPLPDAWAGLVGEYGPDTNVLFVLEKDGKLHLLIEWFYLYPLTELGADTFRLPDAGLYPGEVVRFERKGGGKATRVTAAAMSFRRRTLDGEDGSTFKIKPVKPVKDIRPEALRAKPPAEPGEFRKPELVDLSTVDPTFKFDIRYATENNFMGEAMYTSAKAFLQRPAAEALARVHKDLAKQGYGILVFDGYRPWHVTKMFWEATPEKQRVFVADPSKGSRHNRGCAVDITLYDLKTGKPVDMVSGFDEFSDRAYPDYPGGSSLQRWHRQLLRDAMEKEGFTVYDAEWWHFDYSDWRKYPILNDRFEDLR